MQWPGWKNPKLRRRLLAVLTSVLVVSLAMHPELHLLVPLLDATGIDVLFTLIGIQAVSVLSDSVLPCFRLTWKALAPLVLSMRRIALAAPGARSIRRFLSDLLFSGSGSLGQFVWLHLRFLSRPDGVRSDMG